MTVLGETKGGGTHVPLSADNNAGAASLCQRAEWALGSRRDDKGKRSNFRVEQAQKWMPDDALSQTCPQRRQRPELHTMHQHVPPMDPTAASTS